jgi:hypothetical protein
MDKADRAAAETDALTDKTIENIRRKAKESLMHTGFCFYCYERVHSPHLFCDNDCRDDYYAERAMMTIEGRSWNFK